MSIKKRKRSNVAIAWLVCISMVMATFVGPYAAADAYAAASVPPITVDKEVVDSQWMDRDNGIAKIKLTVNAQDVETTVETPLTTRIVLVLDYSGSMSGTKITTLKQVAGDFVDDMLLLSGVEIGIVIYGSDVKTTQGFTDDADTLKSVINGYSAGGATLTQAGIRSGQAMLDGVTADNEFMLVLSDGVPTYSYQATAGRLPTSADTALNFNSTEWPYVLTNFSNNVIGSGGDYELNPPGPNNNDEYNLNIGGISRTITNNGYGTVSEALLAKQAGTTIFSVGFEVASGGTADKVMKSIASGDDKNFLAGTDDLDVAFETIGSEIVEEAAGVGATVTDPMGFNTDSVNGNDYQFKALIDASHPVTLTSPAGVSSSYSYDTATDTLQWILTTGDIKAGTYTMTYYVQIQDINGNGVGDNVGDVLTNNQAVLAYNDAAGAPQQIQFVDPMLKVEHYTVEYYFNGVIDSSLTTIQAAIAGRTPITVVAPSFPAYDFEKTVYANDASKTSLDIVQGGANNIIKIYYTQKTGTLEVNKEVLKNSLPSDVTDTFYFGLFSEADGTGLIGNVKSVDLVDENIGSVEFTGLTLGTTYYVFETDANGAPITDEVGGFVHLGEYVLDGQGSSFTPSIRDLSGEITIKNQIAVGTSVEFEGTKNLTGRLLGANDVFHFAIFEGDSKTPLAGGQTESVIGSPSSINIVFDKIEYGIGDIGTHTYIVKEVPPIDDVVNGVIFDTLPRTVTVEVSIDAQGIISADVAYPERAKELIFNNDYQAEPTTWTPEVSKTLTGKDITDGMFEFMIMEGDSTDPLQTVTNVGNTVPFTAIEFTEPGTYNFTICEMIPEDADAQGVLDGIRYDDHIVAVEVTVTDNGLGELIASAEYEGDTDFINEYTTKPVTWTPEVTKTLTGKDIADGMFEFMIMEGDSTDPLQTVTNIGNTVPFTAIEFTEPGTYDYVISETKGSLPGVTYDDLEIQVTVVVTDNGDGTMTARASYDGGQEFTNSYEGPGSIVVTKKVVVMTEDQDIQVNYTFYAALFEDQDGTMVRVSEVKELKVVDSASVTATFDKLDLDKTYYVFETDAVGNMIQTEADGTIVTPIIPDWTKISYENAAVTLSENAMNQETTITNVFVPEEFPLFGSITVNKTVTVNGKAFASNRTFYVALFADKELTDMVSEVKALKMNGKASTKTEFLTDMDGNPLEAGTTYYIAETDKNGVPLTGTFEKLGFEISIDTAKVVIAEDTVTVNIINKFKSEDFPLTGDNSDMNLWLFLALLGVAGALAPFAFKKKEETND